MSTKNPKNGRNGKGRNGNGNGRSKSAAKKPAKKSASAKPATKKPKARAPDRGGGQSAMIIRRNDTMMTTRSSLEQEPESRTLGERVEDMGVSHVAAVATGAALSTAVVIGLVANGTLSPKTGAACQIGVGTAATAYGYHAEHDHLMMAGVGIASAGAFSMANQLAIDGYEALEKRAEARKAKKAEEAKKEDAEKAKKQRNARRIVVLDDDGRELDYGGDFAVREAAGDDYPDADERAA